MSKRATMVDIAQAAGVSQATVSLVLNDVQNARVSPETRKRVKEIAAELGYNRKGVGLRATDHRVIGLLIDEVTTTPFAAPLIEGARDEAAAQGCLVAMFCTGGDAGLEQAALDILDATALVGVLYATLVTRSVTAPDRLGDRNAVLLNCHDARRRHDSVLPADLTGAFSAVQALAGVGHRRISHIAGESWGESARDRIKGYRQALATADIAFDPVLLEGPAWTVAQGREATHRLMDLPDPPTAIFCFNDRAAIGCYEALAQRGLHVPLDVSVIGFDNEDLVANLDPPLSTVVLPHDEMARWAVNRLLSRASQNGSAQPPGRTKIECALLLRGSVSAPKAAI